MSNVTLLGTLGGDPEMRFSKSGTAITTFSLAENRGQGNDKVTHWFDVTCFKQLAENVAESLRKGDRIIVSGILEQQRWETDSGDKRSKVAVVAWVVAPSLEYATCNVEKNEREERD